MDLFYMIVSYLGTFAIGGLIGYKISDWITQTAVKELMREAGISDDEINDYVKSITKGTLEPAEEPTQPKVQIRLERVNGNLLCYEKATDQFLGQARDKDELIEVLTKRLGPTTLLINPEDGAKYLEENAVHE